MSLRPSCPARKISVAGGRFPSSSRYTPELPSVSACRHTRASTVFLAHVCCLPVFLLTSFLLTRAHCTRTKKTTDVACLYYTHIHRHLCLWIDNTNIYLPGGLYIVIFGGLGFCRWCVLGITCRCVMLEGLACLPTICLLLLCMSLSLLSCVCFVCRRKADIKWTEQNKSEKAKTSTNRRGSKQEPTDTIDHMKAL